jgi:hypothetical protein
VVVGIISCLHTWFVTVFDGREQMRRAEKELALWCQRLNFSPFGPPGISVLAVKRKCASGLYHKEGCSQTTERVRVATVLPEWLVHRLRQQLG